MVKRIFKWLGILVAAILVLAVTLVLFLTVTEYRPAERQEAEKTVMAQGGAPVGSDVTLYTWNIGYAGLGKESDFFMDGGSMVNPPSREAVEKNLAGIESFIKSADADAWLFQEVDVGSWRTSSIDEFAYLLNAAGGSGALALNYNSLFVPFPLPPIGKVMSGMVTVSEAAMDDYAERVALHCPFSWPVSTANLKRGLLVTRHPVEGGGELVLVNLHLEAYEEGEGKVIQTQQLVSLLEEEYAKGNYVIAGGDFNQTFPGSLDVFPVKNTDVWTPGVLEEAVLPEGWSFAYDVDGATARLNDKPYDGTNQLYVIDGFIVSPNVSVEVVETVDLDFEHSDHNPVRLEVKLGA